MKTIVKNAYAEEANNSHDTIIEEEKIVLDKLQGIMTYILTVIIQIDDWFGLWCLTPLQQYFIYIVAVSVIGGGNGVLGEKHRPAASH